MRKIDKMKAKLHDFLNQERRIWLVKQENMKLVKHIKDLKHDARCDSNRIIALKKIVEQHYLISLPKGEMRTNTMRITHDDYWRIMGL